MLDSSGAYTSTRIYREPNFFELLKAVILNGSVGLGSGNANSFVASDPKYYISGTTPSNLLSADYEIMQIGANIIDSWDADNVPTFINFAGNELAGVENLPYLNKLVFVAALLPQGSGGNVDAWLVPSLWNPHQNGSSATGSVRVALTGNPSYSATFTAGSTIATAGPIATTPAITIDVPANGFIAPTPPKDPNPTPIAMTGAVTSVGPPEKYYGFHFPFTITTPNATAINQKNCDTIYPDFGSTVGNIELQVQLSASPATYKTYQTWKIAATGHPLVAQSVKNNGDFQNTNKMADPEYIALDPRTVRFGVWGTDANGQGGGNAKKDASYGAEDSLDQGAPANRIELITWSGPQGWRRTSP